MILPRAFVDGTREIFQSYCLTFADLGEDLIRQHPRAAELAGSARLVAGWAELACQAVENAGERNFVVDETYRGLFVSGPAHRAFAEIGSALAELDHEKVKLAEEQDVSTAIFSALSFITAMSAVVDILDAVRAPAWQRQWAGVEVPQNPIDVSMLSDSLVLSGNTLELREDGVVTKRLEIDGDASRLVHIQPFGAPRSSGPGGEDVEPSAGDREIALYDWIDERVQELKRAGMPKGFSVPFACSFCGKANDEVKKLIAGPTCFICDECVALCSEIVRGENDSGE